MEKPFTSFASELKAARGAVAKNSVYLKALAGEFGPRVKHAVFGLANSIDDIDFDEARENVKLGVFLEA